MQTKQEVTRWIWKLKNSMCKLITRYLDIVNWYNKIAVSVRDCQSRNHGFGFGVRAVIGYCLQEILNSSWEDGRWRCIRQCLRKHVKLRYRLSWIPMRIVIGKSAPSDILPVLYFFNSWKSLGPSRHRSKITRCPTAREPPSRLPLVKQSAVKLSI